MGVIISSFLFQPPTPPTPLKSNTYFWLKTSLGTNIPAFYIKQPQARFSLIFSHGNAEDLGGLHEYLLTLSKLFYVNILSYDYSGYGLGLADTENIKNSISPSEENCYADIEAACDYLTKIEDVAYDRIILYGRSLGSGPTCYLAEKATKQNKPFAGVILHCPFLSICRVVLDMGYQFPTDYFPNASRIENVGCPTTIIHGTEDKVVPFSHGKELFELTPTQHKITPFWAEKMNHNNIEFDMSQTYVRHLQMFFMFVSEQERIVDKIPISIVVRKGRKEFEAKKQRKGTKSLVYYSKKKGTKSLVYYSRHQQNC